ncbi:MAG: phosphocholine cytidylyltransferase family protein [Deltaproteobacteria bacterium]|nr:phosphocholine cytidylyltransferase family protein [Deltaproteobacteria bacterium]
MSPAPRACAPVAVLLVAGIGQRLRPLTNDRPKALVDVGGETMLARSVRLLLSHGVQELVLATGFCESAVREAMASCPVKVSYRYNPDFQTTQNSMSLLACEDAVTGRAFYKLDGDLLFHASVLGRLDASGADIVAAVDPRASLGLEEMKVRLKPGGGRAIEAFGKGLEPSACWGESIGIERIAEGAVSTLFEALQAARRQGEASLYYEDVYSRMIAGGASGEGVDVGDLGWAEVDTPQDLAAASELVRSGGLGG